jgi:hypothetical protein
VSRPWWLPAALALAACVHGEPFDGDRDPLGPASEQLPRRLTFNVGDDRSPAWSGSGIAYSRYDPARGTRAQCLALLPVDGGTLTGSWCPPDPTPSDTFVSTWLEPARSADGGEVAFVWERGARVSALAAWTHHLVVAPASAPGAPTAQVLIAGVRADSAVYNTASEINWNGAGRVRFLSAYQSIIKVKGGGAERFTDTTLIPGDLLELDVAAGTVGPVPGGAGIRAWTPVADGFWAVAADVLWHVDDAGLRVPLAAVWPDACDVALVDGRAVIARLSPDTLAAGDTTLLVIDPATGASSTLAMPGPVHRLTAAGGRRFVAEVEADGRLFGAPADLWLFELPPPETR